MRFQVRLNIILPHAIVKTYQLLFASSSSNAAVSVRPEVLQRGCPWSGWWLGNTARLRLRIPHVA